MKKCNFKKFREKKFFFSFLLIIFTSKSHLKVILEVKNARSRHEFNIGGCIWTIWSEESCSCPWETMQKISRHLYLNSGINKIAKISKLSSFQPYLGHATCHYRHVNIQKMLHLHFTQCILVEKIV